MDFNIKYLSYLFAMNRDLLFQNMQVSASDAMQEPVYVSASDAMQEPVYVSASDAMQEPVSVSASVSASDAMQEPVSASVSASASDAMQESPSPLSASDAMQEPVSTSDAMEDSSSSYALPIGQISADNLRRFKLFQKLGEGSYGTVYQAIYLPNGKQYVVKIIPRKTPDVYEMAVNEAIVGMTIQSDNLCKTYAYSEDKINVYIIMEHIDGMDLHDFILSKPKIFQTNVNLFWFVVWNILRGIKDLLDAGFVHVDIKPENILLGLEKNRITSVKISDFGLCKRITEIQLCSAGTLNYIAPEIVKNTYRDSRIDIWSLGITMYVMLMMATPSYITSKNPDIQLKRLKVIQNLSSLKTGDVFNPFKTISKNPRFATIQEVIISCLAVDPLSRPFPKELLEKIEEILSLLKLK
jgi:tRNA A-37 threonylcarbamoyl transferase component Bud32